MSAHPPLQHLNSLICSQSKKALPTEYAGEMQPFVHSVTSCCLIHGFNGGGDRCACPTSRYQLQTRILSAEITFTSAYKGQAVKDDLPIARRSKQYEILCQNLTSKVSYHNASDRQPYRFAFPTACGICRRSSCLQLIMHSTL